MTSEDPREEDPDDIWKQLAKLLADLHGMVDAGLLVEVRTPGEPSRYALSELGVLAALHPRLR